jgi:hypothetical protein
MSEEKYKESAFKQIYDLPYYIVTRVWRFHLRIFLTPLELPTTQL